jgi:hypothetical protein
MNPEQIQQLQRWTEDMPKATSDDLLQLTQIETSIKQAFPAEYKEIITNYGFPYFEPAMCFVPVWQKYNNEPFTQEELEGMTDVPERGIATFQEITTLAETYELLAQFPGYIPPQLFPFTKDFGTSYLAFKLDDSPQHGSIWCVVNSDEPWGTGDNQCVGYVAPNLTEFLFTTLQPCD